MKKQITFLSILLILMCSVAEAQYYGGGVYIQRGYRRPPPPSRPPQHYPRKKAPSFKPTVNLSLGYGFPNLDKNYFPDEFYGGVNA